MRRIYKERKVFWLSWIVLCVAWLPVWIAFFPAIYGYDASTQIPQVQQGMYSMHHPILHTLILGYLFMMSEWTQSDVWRAVYSALQMAMLSGAIAYGIHSIWRQTGKKRYVISLLAFFTLIPTHSIMAFVTTKDTMFAAFFLLTFCMLWRAERLQTKKINIIFILSMTGMMLFRNNAFYALVLYMAILLVFRQKRAFPVLKRMAVAVVLFLTISNGLQLAVHGADGSTAEMLSIPLQQMAKVGLDAGDEELTQRIREYIPQIEDYVEYLSDDIKKQITRIDGGLARLYAECLVKYPTICVKAFLRNIESFWNITSSPYEEHKDFLIPLTYYTSPYGEVGFTGKDYQLLPAFRQLYVTMFCDDGIFQFPAIAWIFRQATYVMLMGMVLLVEVVRKRWWLLRENMFLVCYFATLLLAPCTAQRYFYAVLICIPFAVVRTLIVVRQSTIARFHTKEQEQKEKAGDSVREVS